MSDFPRPARRVPRADGAPARDEAGHVTLSPDAPLRPETGSALDLLLRRQSLTESRVGGLLAYVPAQVR